MRKWNEYVFCHQCKTSSHIKTVANKCIAVMFVAVFVAQTIALVAFFWEYDGVRNSPIVGVDKIIPVFIKTESTIIIAKLIFTIFSFFVSLLWALPSILVFTICKGLILNFKGVHRILQKRISGVALVTDKELEKFRFQHQKLCRLTKLADRIFSLYNLVVFVTAIPVLCLFVYTFAFHAFDGEYIRYYVKQVARQSTCHKLRPPHRVLNAYQHPLIQGCFIAICISSVICIKPSQRGIAICPVYRFVIVHYMH